MAMRSCESGSMLWPGCPALPSCSNPVSSSITSAATKLACGAGKCSLVRSASFASVVATTCAAGGTA
eukprot:3365383-Prymnesium_polylepis.1